MVVEKNLRQSEKMHTAVAIWPSRAFLLVRKGESRERRFAGDVAFLRGMRAYTICPAREVILLAVGVKLSMEGDSFHKDG